MKVMKQIQNNQKYIGKFIPDYGFKNSQEKNQRTKNPEFFAQRL
jgi:hypothetical protein